jgi:hypothetical protein
MSANTRKNGTRRGKSRQQTVASLMSEPAQGELDMVKEDIAEVLRAQRLYAASIIAGSPMYQRSELIPEAITLLAAPRIDDYRENIDQFLERVNAAGINVRTPDGKGSPHDISDQVTNLVYAWARAGYTLGLAVGMQLGPHAFDGFKANGKGGAR